MSHTDYIEIPPKGFNIIGSTSLCPVAAMENREMNLYGVQFHPEVEHTEKGRDIIENFLFNICKCSPNWDMKDFINSSIKGIKEKIGDGKAICALSGGVDSSVAAVLVHEAIGDNLVCVFVDHGLLRKDEAEQVEKVFRENYIKDELFKIVMGKNNKKFYLQYQPIIDLRTNKIHGFEALARFQSKELGLVSPAEFIPIAEEMQFIVPIGLDILHMACKFIKKLELAGYDRLNVFVNVSTIQLLRDEFVSDLRALVEGIKINPRNLGIEITESIFMDNCEMVNKKLYALREMGIEISIDDFGTGYSSIYRLRELNVDCIKIDKYFIDKLLKLKTEEVITGDIISMAHKLGCTVIAEGVEHEKQKQYLIDNNCDFVQGYLFSKPLYEKEALRMLGIQD